MSDPHSSSAPDTPAEPKKKTSLAAYSGSLSIVFVILALAAYGVHYFIKQTQPTYSPTYASTFPAECEFTSVDSVTTWWQPPASESIKLNNLITPTAQITLASHSSGSGKLRVNFFQIDPTQQGEHKIIGDTHTLTVTNGLFANGQTSIEVQGTKGMQSMDTFYGYREQDEERWLVVVKAASEGSKDFTLLGQSPVEPLLKGIE